MEIDSILLKIFDKRMELFRAFKSVRLVYFYKINLIAISFIVVKYYWIINISKI